MTFRHVYYDMVQFSRGTRVLFCPYRDVLDSGIVFHLLAPFNYPLPDPLSHLVLKSYY